MSTKTLVLLSGGLDSTALLARAVNATPGDVMALTVNYGQRHIRELQAAHDVAEHLDVPHTVIDLGVLREHLHSALTGAGPVPHGHYADDNMRQTVVPNRNAIMLMVAVGIAASRGARVVQTAVHAGDHTVYPDCRPEFITAIGIAAQLGTQGFGDVFIDAPFVHLSKAQVVTVALMNSAPVHLSWSCYEGGRVHCGRCGTCVERAEAFHLADLPDPTEYADPSFWREQVHA